MLLMSWLYPACFGLKYIDTPYSRHLVGEMIVTESKNYDDYKFITEVCGRANFFKVRFRCSVNSVSC